MEDGDDIIIGWNELLYGFEETLDWDLAMGVVDGAHIPEHSIKILRSLLMSEIKKHPLKCSLTYKFAVIFQQRESRVQTNVLLVWIEFKNRL